MSVHIQRESIFLCKKHTKSYENMGKLRRHDWRSHREIECTICRKTLQNREKISDHRKLEHRMFKKSKCRFFPNCIDEDECFFEYDNNFVGDKEGERKLIYCPEEMNCNDQGCEAKHNNKNVMCVFQIIDFTIEHLNKDVVLSYDILLTSYCILSKHLISKILV